MRDKLILLRSALSIVLFIVTGFLCSAPDEVPQLSADCVGEPFHLYGEITRIWRASVEPDHDYTVIVTGGSALHRINDLYIGVTDVRSTFIGTDTYYVTDAILDFSSGAHHEVFIRVYSKIGEGNEDLGQYEIKLCIV